MSTDPEPLRITDVWHDDLLATPTYLSQGGARAVDLTISFDGEESMVVLDEARVRELRDWLTAWLDAPRLAARDTAEVVAEDVEDGVRLLKTSAGEWGVKFDGEPGDFTRWYASEAEARDALAFYADSVTCDGCNKLIHADDATDHGDGYYCEPCADAAREEFRITRYRCADGGVCEWTGLGPELRWNPDTTEHVCPACGGEVEEAGERVAEAPSP